MLIVQIKNKASGATTDYAFMPDDFTNDEVGIIIRSASKRAARLTDALGKIHCVVVENRP